MGYILNPGIPLIYSFLVNTPTHFHAIHQIERWRTILSEISTRSHLSSWTPPYYAGTVMLRLTAAKRAFMNSPHAARHDGAAWSLLPQHILFTARAQPVDRQRYYYMYTPAHILHTCREWICGMIWRCWRDDLVVKRRSNFQIRCKSDYMPRFYNELPPWRAWFRCKTLFRFVNPL